MTTAQLGLFDLPSPEASQSPTGIRPTLTAPAAPSTATIDRLIPAALDSLRTGTHPRTHGAVATWAERVLDRSYIAGDFTIDNAYDAIETAAVLHALTETATLPDIQSTTGLGDRITQLRDLEAYCFNGRAISEHVRAHAQFSTPLPLAIAPCLAAGVRPDETVLEPCAGTGSLLLPLLRPTDRREDTPRIVANEIDPSRVAALKHLGIDATCGDALRLPLDRTLYPVVLTNPPFGAVKTGNYGRNLMTGFPCGDIAQRFFAAALECTVPGGRVAAIMPCNTLGDAGIEFRSWLTRHHTPLAYITSPAESYRSRGVRGGSVLVLVDHGHTNTYPADTLLTIASEPSWETWTQAIEHLATRTSPRRPAMQTRATAALPADPKPRTSSRPSPTTSSNRTTAACTTHAIPAHQLPRATIDSDRLAHETAEAENSTIFTPYTPAVSPRSPHPRLIVETRSQAGISAPPCSSTFRSPIVNEAWGRYGAHGGVSDEQAELALRILDAWDRRHGFLCADDVGVGKSREAALVILESLHRGTRRVLYTTKNEVNLRDFEEELRRVHSGSSDGPAPATIVSVGDFPDAKDDTDFLPTPDGPVIYLAHSYNFASFVDAIIAIDPQIWIADEAHEYKRIAQTLRGDAWVRLHDHMLPRNRPIAYFTATPGVTLDELEYLYGLREWPIGGFREWLERKTGLTVAERDHKAIAETLEQTAAESIALGDAPGIPTDDQRSWGRTSNDAFTIRVTAAETEQVMRELKGSGRYLSRDLWRGGVNFAVEQIDLLSDTPDACNARALYDSAAELCRDITTAALRFGRMNKRDRTAGLDRAMIQGYLKQLLFTLRLPTVLRRADTALENGHQAIISIHSVSGDDTDDDDNVATLNARLESAITRINTEQIEKDGTGPDATYLELGEIPEALLVRADLLDRLAALPPLPDPVRQIQDHFGPDDVATITGQVPARRRAELMAEFQSGQRRVALISRAGKIGISLHDTNGRPRTMLVADYEWSADTFKQELGRVDRTGQLSSPTVILVASNVAGERKFAATIAARMASLGATSKGSAESTGTEALEIFDMSGNAALAAMRNASEIYPPGIRRYYTGSKFVEFTNSRDGLPRLEPKRRIDPSTTMRHFLLEIMLFPITVGNDALAIWEEQYDTMITGDLAEYLASRRTGRTRGEITRTTQLADVPRLTLYEVKNDAGGRQGILQGFVTIYIGEIQRARGTVDGKLKSRTYVQFTAHDGTLISGLELTPGETRSVMQLFGRLERTEITPETVLEDLQAGDKVPIQGPRNTEWLLHPRKDRRIEIRGALISRDRDVLMIPSLKQHVHYEPTGNYLFIDPVAIAAFLAAFPPALLANAA